MTATSERTEDGVCRHLPRHLEARSEKQVRSKAQVRVRVRVRVRAGCTVTQLGSRDSGRKTKEAFKAVML